MLISDCCGAPNRGNGDTDYAEFGICPSCREHCTFYDDEEDEPLDEDQLQALYAEEEKKKQQIQQIRNNIENPLNLLP